MVKKTGDKGYGMGGFPSSSELSENMLRQNFRLGDITWIKHSGSGWWPAQVVDEACVSNKPKKKTSHDALVRLYGTYQYLYVDPWKSNVEFETILKKENKTGMEVFHEVLEKELSRVRPPIDYDDGAVNSKARTSSRKVRKQEVESNATTGAASRKGRKQEDAEQSGDENSAEGSRDKRASVVQDRKGHKTATVGTSVVKKKVRKQEVESNVKRRKQEDAEQSSDTNSDEGSRDKRASVVQDRKGHKTATVGPSVVKREGMRRSGRTNAKEYEEAAEDGPSQLYDTNASEDATEVRERKNDSVVHGTHGEIKAMVRDILLGDIISRQHDAEMAYVDDVIFGICNGINEKVTDLATAATRDGQGIKRPGSTLEADSGNVTQRSRNRKIDNSTEDPKQVIDPEAMNSLHSRDAAMELGQSNARQIKIMQSLDLIAPDGFPFGGSGLVT